MTSECRVSPLPEDLHLVWNDLRTVLLRDGDISWVPFMETQLADCHKARVLGREVRSLRDEVAVASLLGRPFVRVSIGLQDAPSIFRVTRSGEHEWTGSTSGLSEGLQAASNLQDRSWITASAPSQFLASQDVEDFPWPAANSLDYGILDEADRVLPDSTRLIVSIGKIFNLAWWMMGLEQFSLALHDQPEMIAALYRRISEIQLEVLERVLEHRCVGAIWHSDDMAYKSGPIVSPSVLHQHVFPVYKVMNRECELRGIPTVFHSDGKMDVLMEDIIAAGFCAFNPIEPGCMDIRALKKQVNGRLTLIGNVDLSYTLTRGSPTEVDTEVRDLIGDLGPGGGYALASANSIPDYVPWENFVAMHTAWLKYGRHPFRGA